MIAENSTRVVGAVIYTVDRYSDDRGFFEELASVARPEYPFQVWKQLNHSVSCAGAIRGLHMSPYPKLATCVKGEMFDVVVDLRKDSPTYMKWEGVWLRGKKQLFVPAYCGHGNCTVEDDTHLIYLQGGTFDPKTDFLVNWKDPNINITWPELKEYIVSEKDRNAPFWEV